VLVRGRRAPAGRADRSFRRRHRRHGAPSWPSRRSHSRSVAGRWRLSRCAHHGTPVRRGRRIQPAGRHSPRRRRPRWAGTNGPLPGPPSDRHRSIVPPRRRAHRAAPQTPLARRDHRVRLHAPGIDRTPGRAGATSPVTPHALLWLMQSTA